MSLDDESAEAFLKSDVDVEQETEKNIRIEEMRTAIRKLPESDRKLINEYFFEDVSLRQLAKRYGVSHTFLNGRINAILIKLREYIIHKDD